MASTFPKYIIKNHINKRREGKDNLKSMVGYFLPFNILIHFIFLIPSCHTFLLCHGCDDLLI